MTEKVIKGGKLLLTLTWRNWYISANIHVHEQENETEKKKKEKNKGRFEWVWYYMSHNSTLSKCSFSFSLYGPLSFCRQIKADIEAMKEQMATMMEAMMSMKKIMEANAVAIAATSAVAKVNPTPPSGLNQMNHPTSDMVGKDLGSTGGPHYAKSQNKHAFPPYGLPPNYTPSNVAYPLSENVNNFTPIPIESQQPQFW